MSWDFSSGTRFRNSHTDQDWYGWTCDALALFTKHSSVLRQFLNKLQIYGFGCLWAWGLLVASFRTKGVTQYRLKKIQTRQEEKRKIFSPFKGQFDLICHGLLSMASGAFAHVHRDHQTQQVMRFHGDCCAEGKNQRELAHDIQLKVRSS